MSNLPHDSTIEAETGDTDDSGRSRRGPHYTPIPAAVGAARMSALQLDGISPDLPEGGKRRHPAAIDSIVGSVIYQVPVQLIEVTAEVKPSRTIWRSI
jgi:hypothetical protein